MAKNSLGHNASSDPEDRVRGMEHIGRLAPRAMLPTTRLRPCVGCGGRFIGRDLYTVMDWHESLTFFEGDSLCEECARNHGLL